MASWLTLYITTPADGLTATALEGRVRQADWWTLAANWGLDEALAETLDPRYLQPGSDGGFDGVVQYAQDRRPIQIHRWAAPERVAEERHEALERELPDAARAYVEGAVEVVGLEMGWSAHETGGVLVAWELATQLARHCHHAAAIRDDDDRWYVPDDWTWRQL
jgi:hypothetical protein